VPPEPAPPCLGCGTCCFSKLATFVRVDGFDHARLGARADALTVFTGNRCHMTMSDGHCAASVYDDRPAVCRELERGSPECRAERHEKGERPLMVLRRMGEEVPGRR
jgi:uncharacterized protein